MQYCYVMQSKCALCSENSSHGLFFNVKHELYRRIVREITFLVCAPNYGAAEGVLQVQPILVCIMQFVNGILYCIVNRGTSTSEDFHFDTLCVFTHISMWLLRDYSTAAALGSLSKCLAVLISIVCIIVSFISFQYLST